MAEIARLSNTITECSKIVTDYLTTKGLEAPSFDVNGLAEYPIPPSDEAPFKARLKLIEATKELHDPALGPKEGLRFLAWDVYRPSSIKAQNTDLDSVRQYALSLGSL
jgi:hypothetical protein